jgi:hypothetical protein
MRVARLARAALPLLVGLMLTASALAMTSNSPGGAGAVAMAVKPPSTAVDDSFTVPEDSGPTMLPVRSNDLKGTGPFKVVSSTNPANGTVAVPPNGHDLSYRPDPGHCNSGAAGSPDTFQYTLSGGSTATVSVTVTCIDDPSVAANDSATVGEDDPATTIDVRANDSDPDGPVEKIQSVDNTSSNGTVAITNAGDDLTYAPDADYCNDPGAEPDDSFTYTLAGGSTATVSVTVICVNDAPVADDETFDGAQSAVGNTTFVGNDPSDGPPTAARPKKTITGSILAGDADVDGPGPLVVSAGTFVSNDGGSVTLEADGDFVFEPAAATSCTDHTDFFDYTVSDQNAGTDTGRVTIAIAGCVWYVSNSAAGNSGTSNAPFDTLAQAETASGINQTVFVFDGDNTTTGYATGYAMNAGERLIGEHEGLVVDPDGGGPLGTETLHPANPGARPTLTATNADVIDLGEGTVVRGVNLNPSGTGGGIAGGAGDSATISNNSITVANGASSAAISISQAGAGAMRMAITNNTISYAGTQFAIVVQAGQGGNGSLDTTITGNTIDIQLDGTGDALTGILAQNAITGPGVTSSLCADIGGAGALSNTFTHSLGGTIAGGDMRARQSNDGTVRLPGYGGGATDTSAVASYLDGRNTEVSPSTATFETTGFAGGAACPQPAL